MCTATGTRQSPLGLGTWCALGNAVGRGAAPRAAETHREEDYGRVVEQPQQRHETDGIALALTFLIGGGLCLLAPKYFAATGWEETAWHVAGLVLATFGALGLISELSPTGAGETVLSDVAVGLVLFALAIAVALAIQVLSLPSPWDGLSRSFVALVGFFAVYGSIAGVREWLRSRRGRSENAKRSHMLISLVVATLGVATAALNLYGAFNAISQVP